MNVLDRLPQLWGEPIEFREQPSALVELSDRVTALETIDFAGKKGSKVTQKKNCVKGSSCGFTCIRAGAVCRSEMKGKEKEFAGYLKKSAGTTKGKAKADPVEKPPVAAKKPKKDDIPDVQKETIAAKVDAKKTAKEKPTEKPPSTPKKAKGEKASTVKLSPEAMKPGDKIILKERKNGPEQNYEYHSTVDGSMRFINRKDLSQFTVMAKTDFNDSVNYGILTDGGKSKRSQTKSKKDSSGFTPGETVFRAKGNFDVLGFSNSGLAKNTNEAYQYLGRTPDGNLALLGKNKATSFRLVNKDEIEAYVKQGQIEIS